MNEATFKRNFFKRLEQIFPGVIILPGDAFTIQGIPDAICLYNEHWFALEFKANKKAHRQPNQEYYVGLLNQYSYAAFVYPENADAILDDLANTFL